MVDSNSLRRCGGRSSACFVVVRCSVIYFAVIMAIDDRR